MACTFKDQRGTADPKWVELMGVITYKDSVEADDSTSALQRLSRRVRHVLADAGLGSVDYSVHWHIDRL